MQVFKCWSCGGLLTQEQNSVWEGCDRCNGRAKIAYLEDSYEMLKKENALIKKLSSKCPKCKLRLRALA